MEEFSLVAIFDYVLGKNIYVFSAVRRIDGIGQEWR